MSILGTFDTRRHGGRRPPQRQLRGGSRLSADIPIAAPYPPTKRRRAASSRILVAGSDPDRRAAVLRDLSEALPDGTQFGEAGAAWEVLEQASSSGVVMLAGDLDEVTAESLMNVLGHRHPSLPVVALGLFAGGGSVADGHLPRAASAAR
jgi:hypothetical protein